MLGIRNPAFLGAAAGFSPLSLSPALWLDASDSSTITASGSPLKVSQWNDKSGNGRNVTQATATNQPITGAVTQNGLNSVKFETNDFLRHSTAATWTFLHDGTKYIIAQVVRFGDTADPNNYAYNYNTATGNTTRGSTFLYDSRSTLTGRVQHAVYTGGGASTEVVENNSADGAFPGNQFRVVSVLADPGNATAANRSFLYSNASAAYTNNTRTGTPSSSAPSTAFTLGFNPNGTVQYVGELIIVSGANATETNRALLRDYLNAKWAVY